MFHSKAIGLLLAGILGGTALAAPAALNKYGGGALRTMLEGNLGRWMILRSELNLTPDQRAKVHQVLGTHRSEILGAVKDVYERRTALREAVRGGENETAIRQAADRLGKAIGDAAVLTSKVGGEVKPLLTDAQRKLIAETRRENNQSIEKFFDEAMKVQ